MAALIALLTSSERLELFASFSKKLFAKRLVTSASDTRFSNSTFSDDWFVSAVSTWLACAWLDASAITVIAFVRAWTCWATSSWLGLASKTACALVNVWLAKSRARLSVPLVADWIAVRKVKIFDCSSVLSATVSVEELVAAASVFSSLAWDEAVSSLASLVRTGSAS